MFAGMATLRTKRKLFADANAVRDKEAQRGSAAHESGRHLGCVPGAVPAQAQRGSFRRFSGDHAGHGRRAGGAFVEASVEQLGVALAQDVKPLLAARCLRCHSPQYFMSSGTAPYDYTNYASAALYAHLMPDAIKRSERRMPLGARALADWQIETIENWANEIPPSP